MDSPSLYRFSKEPSELLSDASLVDSAQNGSTPVTFDDAGLSFSNALKDATTSFNVMPNLQVPPLNPFASSGMWNFATGSDSLTDPPISSERSTSQENGDSLPPSYEAWLPASPRLPMPSECSTSQENGDSLSPSHEAWLPASPRLPMPPPALEDVDPEVSTVKSRTSAKQRPKPTLKRKVSVSSTHASNALPNQEGVIPVADPELVPEVPPVTKVPSKAAASQKAQAAPCKNLSSRVKPAAGNGSTERPSTVADRKAQAASMEAVGTRVSKRVPVKSKRNETADAIGTNHASFVDARGENPEVRGDKRVGEVLKGGSTNMSNVILYYMTNI
ncbi:hypothetical protein PAXINDRAFT_156977 [Paxillus involutus ATCC 200175]|uniref:Uncharacterized protein n=1 Tax=Paxillus involutus ATCC 200175 TaxID=664439 RepID=A0A0C9TXM6_PAXIN|nr:hypothetical protein PAXINDRAFT_156977 [Paxillus involutus ATCC 200175]